MSEIPLATLRIWSRDVNNIQHQVPCACVCQSVPNCRASSALCFPPSLSSINGMWPWREARGCHGGRVLLVLSRCICPSLVLCATERRDCFHPLVVGQQRSRPCASLTSPSSVPNAAERAAHNYFPRTVYSAGLSRRYYYYSLCESVCVVQETGS